MGGMGKGGRQPYVSEGAGDGEEVGIDSEGEGDGCSVYEGL